MRIRKRILLRSDQLSAWQGWGSFVSIGEGLKFKDMMRRGVRQETDYVEHRYHQPTDDTYREWILRRCEMAMFGYELGVQAASQPN